MSSTKQSPILAFLMDPKNIQSVLEILPYRDQVRNEVALRFWGKLEKAFKVLQPVDLDQHFLWDKNCSSTKPGDDFFLEARLSPSEKSTQGLKYMIEAKPDYIGLGLAWLNEENKFAQICQQSRAIIDLQKELAKTFDGKDIERDPNEWYIWWEFWEKHPYEDPWIWFATVESDDAWLAKAADKFWLLVRHTYPLVSEVNRTIGQTKP